LLESALHVDDTELAIFDFAMSSHRPQKGNAVTGH
jgi:hypothetical protein